MLHNALKNCRCISLVGGPNQQTSLLFPCCRTPLLADLTAPRFVAFSKKTAVMKFESSRHISSEPWPIQSGGNGISHKSMPPPAAWFMVVALAVAGACISLASFTSNGADSANSAGYLKSALGGSALRRPLPSGEIQGGQPKWGTLCTVLNVFWVVNWIKSSF